MFETKINQNKITLFKEIRKILKVKNGDYVEYVIEHIRGEPVISIKKHYKFNTTRILT